MTEVLSNAGATKAGVEEASRRGDVVIEWQQLHEYAVKELERLQLLPGSKRKERAMAGARLIATALGLKEQPKRARPKPGALQEWAELYNYATRQLEWLQVGTSVPPERKKQFAVGFTLLLSAVYPGSWDAFLNKKRGKP